MNPTSNLRILLVLFAAVAGGAPLAAADSPLTKPLSPRDAAEIAQRALPFVLAEAREWRKDRKCVSCHQVPSMLWSHHTAARAGLTLDRKELAEWSEWSVDWRNWPQPNQKQTEAQAVGGNVDTIYALLLGRDVAASAGAPWVADFRQHLLKTQQREGLWKGGGQLPGGKRPAREVNEVATMWALLALKSSGPENAPFLDAQKRATNWLAAAKPGVSAEWFALRLLLNGGGAPLPDRDTALADLLKAQHDDGSWGWRTDEPGDAFGTGVALYALGRSGVAFTHDSVQRAIRFLQSTQRPDGSWAVPSTRKSDNNKIRATATDWGSAWAVVGMLQWAPAVPARSAAAQ